MLTAELRTGIESKWKACWPISQVKPLVFLDLLTYLLFIKKIDDRQLLSEGSAPLAGDNFIYTIEQDELRWSRFKDLNAQNLHNVFIKEHGVLDFIKNYGQSKHLYSLFLKEPLLLIPTPGLLANTVDIVKTMEAEDDVTTAAIYEYLLNKVEIIGQNGHVYAPGYVVKLMVALMQPDAEDVLLDPSAGNGSFLVNSAKYVAVKDPVSPEEIKKEFSEKKYKGIESDLIQLRICAMNMILHGIEHPELEAVNVYHKTNVNLKEQPTLILSNLFFKSPENDIAVGAGTSKTDLTISMELYFLNLILRSMKAGTRAALIVPEIVLYDNETKIKTIRQQIIDDCKLQAVISLPVKAASVFSGASIVIFNKLSSSITDKVWFYKMKTAKAGLNKNAADLLNTVKPDALNFTEEYDDVLDILSRWNNEEQELARQRTAKSFYVYIDEIKNNNYNLSYNEYKKNTEEISNQYEAGVADKEITKWNSFKNYAAPHIAKIRRNIKVTPVKNRFSLILIFLFFIWMAEVAFTFLYFKDDHIAFTLKRSTDSVKPVSNISKLSPDTISSQLTTAEQTKAIMKDTSATSRLQKQGGDVLDSIKDPENMLVRYNIADTAAGYINDETDKYKSRNTSKKYLVIDTAYFNNKPDKSTRRKTYLDPLNKNVLNPIDDKNGFIYVVYTNRLGLTSKGWIDKKNLKPLR